jgi:hypothetical protein
METRTAASVWISALKEKHLGKCYIGVRSAEKIYPRLWKKSWHAFWTQKECIYELKDCERQQIGTAHFGGTQKQ